MSLENLKDILLKARARFPGFGRRLHEAEAVSRWETAVGTLIAKHTRVLWVRNQVLFVEVDHPVWRSELHHQKQRILDLLNARTDAEKPVVFIDIFFVDAVTGASTESRPSGAR